MVHKKDHRVAPRKRAGRVLSLMIWALFVALILPNSILVARQQPDKLLPEEFRDKVPYLSSLPMFLAAEALNITTIAGKDITAVGGSPPGSAKAKKLKDVGIGIHPTKHENEPTVVANPKSKKRLVAGSHYFGLPVPTTNKCVAYTSSDGGATWSAPIIMPSLSASSSHSDPVLAYAPDGSRVYYAYMDIKPGGNWDIVVSYSNDDGQTWVGPIVALDGNPAAFIYDKPWIGTHVDESQSNWVYVTATQFGFVTPDHIAFASSGTNGTSWNPPVLFDAAVGATVVQGSRPAGGVGGEVLVAYYHSGSDGWLVGSFEIRTVRSSDNGATWDPIVTAVTDSYECPFWLGPFSFYHRFWGTMFPDVEIDAKGGAYVIYTHDPVAGSTTSEEGDIRYITSGSPPYGSGSWSAPVTVSDDATGRAQGYAALKVGNGGQLHVIWEDHRTSPVVPILFPNSSNLYYDIFYSRNTPGQGSGWFSNFRVSEASSINDFVFIGDYNDLAANNTTLFGVWTDRRHQTSIFAFEDNVFGSRIIAGGGLGKGAALAMGKGGSLESYALDQNYPNPFNPETSIRFQLPEASHVVVKLFNTLGQEIVQLANAEYSAGSHALRWDGKDQRGRIVPSGVYLYQLQAGEFLQWRKMTLLR